MTKKRIILKGAVIPGDILEIKNTDLYINGKPQILNDKIKNQFKYYVKTDGSGFRSKTLNKYSVYEGRPLSNKGEYELILNEENKTHFKTSPM